MSNLNQHYRDISGLDESWVVERVGLDLSGTAVRGAIVRGSDGDEEMLVSDKRRVKPSDRVLFALAFIQTML